MERARQGVGFWGLLMIAFIVLKLTKTITWSWFWVLCPLWGGVAVLVTLLAVISAFVGLVFGIAALLNAGSKWKRKRRAKK